MAKKETKTNRYEQILDDEKNKKTISIKYVGLLKNKWCFVDGNGKESKIPKYKDDDSVLSALPVKMITVTHKRVPDSQAGILSQLNGLTVEEAECFFTKLMTITGYAAQLKQTFILKPSPQELEERLNKILDSDYVKGMVYYMPEEEIPYALIAELAEIDGNKLVYEDILQMDLEDVIALQGEISGKFEKKTPTPTTTNVEKEQETQTNVPSPTVSPSSTYVKSQDGNIQK